MQTTWRERNQQTRIKSAKEALDKNPEYVIYLQLYSVHFFVITTITTVITTNCLNWHLYLYVKNSDNVYDAVMMTKLLLDFSRFIWWMASCGAGAPLFPPCPFTSSSFPPFYFSLFFIGFIYFLLLSIPSPSTRIVPLRFQAGGRRRRPNLGIVCVLLCNLCYLYSLVKMDCGVLFYLV